LRVNAHKHNFIFKQLKNNLYIPIKSPFRITKM